MPSYQRDLRLDADGNARENVIAPPRGLPEDASPETVAALAEALDSSPGGRPSWLTLRELLEFDWEQAVHRSGWLPLELYPRFLEIDRPPSDMTWSIDQLRAESDDYAYLAEEEATRVLAQIPELAAREPTEGLFVRVEWEEPYSYEAEQFVSFVRDELTRLGTPEAVRIVFIA